jgi:drug/metabolite transporter (DMT)-like permease
MQQAQSPVLARLPWRPVALVVLLALVWGANMAAIKISARELPPLFLAALRSAVAAFCLWVWMAASGIRVFPSGRVAAHGAVLGAMFGVEFGLIYVGLGYTLASRTYVLVYTAPFFVALGAHLFLQGDRLNAFKAAGLVLAFAGVVVLFQPGFASYSLSTLPGDLMALAGGALWGSTTVYLKRFLAHRTLPLQTLFYQVFFSAPLLLGLHLALESWPALGGLAAATWLAVFYQSVIVAFLSYLLWFTLIHRFPVSLLHAFSFATPVAGVLLSGLLILGEPLTPRLLMALALVCLGLVLVNREPRRG